ncbi:MAG TPA: flagellar hook-basal body complex protein FliE [Geminicoccaceae bacterium]|nr:flagellar hook-basal body complex protein FliE [Geminicoccaceae bacterium]
MDPLVSRAIAGYAQASAPAPGRKAPTTETPQAQDFASFFRSLAEQSVGTMQTAEQASIQGLQGGLDAQSVVEAVAAAELTLQTVTAVRDRVVEAYQELIRMPI